MMETAQLLGNLGEFAGALIVMGTLVYLALQIKEARRALVAQSYQFRTDAVSDLQIELAQNSEILHVLEKARDLEAIDQLDEIERLRLVLVQMAIMNQLENQCFQYLQGFVTSDVAEYTVKSAKGYVPTWEKLGLELRPALAAVLSDR